MARKTKYANYYICFDIETSKVKLPDGTYFQIVYLVCSQLVNGTTHEIEEKRFFRTIKEFLDYLSSDTIYKCLDIKKKTRLLVFAHNLDYEITFINRELKSNMLVDEEQIDDWGESRSCGVYRDTHAPLSIRLEKLPHIDFRCTYALSNKSLAEIGKEVGLEKLEYEYEKIRLPFHELTKQDYDYNERDVDITRLYIKHLCEERGYTLENIRLSKTSMVVDNRLKHTEKYYPTKTKNGYNNDQQRKCTNRFLYHKHDYKFYLRQTQSYYGGTTTCHPNYTNKLIRKIYSVDIKSSYPHVMCCYRIPQYDITSTVLRVDNPNDYYQTHLRGTNHFTLNKRDNHNTDNVKGFYGLFTFKNIRLKRSENGELYLPTLSISKSEIGFKNVDAFNGKLISADTITFSFNNIGLDCVNLMYEYDEIICEELNYTTKLSFLPLNEMTNVLEGFAKKETLPKDTLEYNLSKEDVNSQYGLKVQKMIKNKFMLNEGVLDVLDYYTKTKPKPLSDEEWEQIKEDVYNRHMDLTRENYGLQSNNKNLMKRWDIFSDGTYITDLARYQLLDMVVRLTDLGFSVVYTDTDSIKFTVDEWQFDEPSLEEEGEITQFILDYFDEYNEEIIKYNSELVQFQNIKEWLNLNEEQYRKICKLGIFEIETGVKDENFKKITEIKPLPYFKTLGAKKYAYIEENKNGELKVKTTISGCNKTSLPKAIVNHQKKTGFYLHESLNICFSGGNVFHPDVSGRTTSSYEQRSDDELPTHFYEQELIEGEYHMNKEICYPLDQKGGLVIESCAYTLNMTDNDYSFINMEIKKPRLILTIEGELREMTEEEKKKYLRN